MIINYIDLLYAIMMKENEKNLYQIGEAKTLHTRDE